MSNLHDWQNADKALVSEYVDCLQTGDTARMREIQGIVHKKNKQVRAKNPGAIARLMGFFKPKKETLTEKLTREMEEKK